MATGAAPLLAFPAAARAAGLDVITLPGWQTRGYRWERGDPFAAVWHHDASPKGDSPGVPSYMGRQIDKGSAGAQLWVDLAGRWVVVAAGVAWHAGAVLPGKPGNYQSVGIETDHTTGEDWPPAQIDSLRLGTAVLLGLMGSGSDRLEFHRTVCSPPGRKTDPDGLDLTAERRRVGTALDRLTAATAPVVTPTRKAPTMFVAKYGSTRYRLVTGDRYLKITEALALSLAKQGVPFVGIGDEDEASLATLVTEAGDGA